jgi:hypothetical protein
MTTTPRERHHPDAVRIAGGQGFYGDAPGPLVDVLTEEPDYVVLEALAELTLAILAKDRQRDETLGWTRDLPLYLLQLLPAVLEGKTTVITNAGGINPVAAGRMVTVAAERYGLSGFTVATVVGDDLRAHPEMLPADVGDPEQLEFANAYLGARPIVEALEAGADVVITGRVADAALFLAPLVHRHGWGWKDWNRLAAGTVVGHLLECSGQATGGNHAGRWWDVPQPWRFGFPLADVAPDGTAEIFKPAVAGGRVDFDTVRQQLLYEVHDPSRYLTPDVVVDMTTVHLDDLGGDTVRVSGATGQPATGTYKVVAASADGYAADLSLAFGWPDAEAKARAAADLARKRIEVAGIELDDWHVELFGVNALHGDAVPAPSVGEDTPAASAGCEPPEVVLRMAWRHADRDKCAEAARHIIPLGLSGPPPGFTPASRARPRASSQLRIHTGLVDRTLVDGHVGISIVEV